MTVKATPEMISITPRIPRAGVIIGSIGSCSLFGAAVCVPVALLVVVGVCATCLEVAAEGLLELAFAAWTLVLETWAPFPSEPALDFAVDEGDLAVEAIELSIDVDVVAWRLAGTRRPITASAQHSAKIRLIKT